MIDNIRVGRSIKTLRERAGLTQKQLAEQLFVSNVAVSKWETGKSVPDVEMLKKLSSILDLDVDGLLGGTATYRDESWQGILLLREDNIVKSDTILFDKPAIDYLVSYFLLAGIRNITIICTEQDKAFIQSRFHNGDLLNVKLRFICDELPRSVKDETGKPFYENGSIMFIPSPFFIYGPDLSRFFDRAMQHNKQLVNLVSVTGKEKSSPLLKNVGGLKQETHYNYESVPVFFSDASLINMYLTNYNRQSFLNFAACSDRFLAEPMDKGFLVSALRDPEDIESISVLVDSIQKVSDCIIYCPLEIAWRRGMISKTELTSASASFPEYEQYINLF